MMALPQAIVNQGENHFNIAGRVVLLLFSPTLIIRIVSDSFTRRNFDTLAVLFKEKTSL